MLRVARWSLIGALLLVGLALLPVAGAASIAIVPTPTATPPPPTNTPTPGPTDTPTPIPTNTPTPIASATPTPGGAPPTPRPNPSPHPNPSPTPTGDVRLVKSVDPSVGYPGDTIVFTIVAHNEHSIPATNVEIDDDIPGVFEISDATVSQGTVSVSGQHVHAVVGTIAPGQSVTLRITTRIRPDTPPGQITNVAVLHTDTPGDDPGNNTATAVVTIPPPGSPTPTPGAGGPPTPTPRPPVRLPPTGDDGLSVALLALPAALLALLAGLLIARRAPRRG